MGELIVQKFGGTSVGTPERIRAIAQRIAAEKEAGSRLVVVVSAMGQTTDDLLQLAAQVSAHPAPREIDMLLTAGERITMALLSLALADRGVRALSFTGSQTGIITTSHHRRARIQRILGDRVRAAIADGAVAIVAGFQGVSEAKEITTLGRGGSDTTAVALAAALGAARCDIFTDVDGVFTADPRWVPGARRLPTIAHDHMVELAQRGAGVLHPRSVEVAQKYGVPLWVRNSLQPDSKGTQIMTQENMEATVVRGVAHDEGKSLFEVSLMRPGVASAIWDISVRHGLTLLAPAFADGRLTFFIENETADDWRRHCQALSVDGFLRSYSVQEDLVPVSIVGSRLTQDGAVLARAFEILDQNAISVTMGQATSLAITLVVRRNRAAEAVQLLHEALIESAPEISGDRTQN